MNINLHIERMILDGLPMSDDQRALVQAAVQTELVGLLSTDGLAITSSDAVAQITAGEVHFQPDATARQLGRQIARSVHAQLNQSSGADQPARRAVPQAKPASSLAPIPRGLPPSPGNRAFNAYG